MQSKSTKITKKDDKHPDPYNHKVISLIKSTIRIAGCGLLLTDIGWAAVFFAVAEILGIVEELV